MSNWTNIVILRERDLELVHQALSVDYLRERGLASLLEIWTRLAAKKRTAQCEPACCGGVGGALRFYYISFV